MSFFTILASAAAVFQTTADSPVKPVFGSCLADSQLVFQSGTITQLQTKGKNVIFSMYFNNTGLKLDNGTLEYTMNLNGIPYTYSQNICAIYEDMCPLRAGFNEFHTNPLDVSDINGRMKLTTYVKHLNGSELMCVYGDMWINNGQVQGLDFVEDAVEDDSEDADEDGDEDGYEDADETDEYTDNFEEKGHDYNVGDHEDHEDHEDYVIYEDADADTDADADANADADADTDADADANADDSVFIGEPEN